MSCTSRSQDLYYGNPFGCTYKYYVEAYNHLIISITGKESWIINCISFHLLLLPFLSLSTAVNENATKMCLVGDTIKENVAGVATIGQIIVQDPDLPIRTCGPPPQPHTELPTNYTCSVSLDYFLLLDTHRVHSLDCKKFILVHNYNSFQCSGTT